jgi:aromatic-L-amino-acid decarboxylase
MSDSRNAAGMPVDEFRRAGTELVDWIAEFLAGIRDYPVLARVKPGDIAARLPASGPEQGEPMERILADFRDIILPGITHWNHPGFHGYFSITGSAPGILGELLTAALNVNGMLWKSSPSATELEQVVLGWLREWVGLPEGFFGIVYDTASISTTHAIAAAREQAAPEARMDGVPPGLVMYTSEQAHNSVDKGAIALGIGHRNVRKVPVDEKFRMKPEVLSRMIEEDLAAGRRPFCVVATAGTTSTSSIDPIPAIADIAERHGLWLHVDGAYGGPAAIVPELRGVLDGAGRADSIVINPHKWLFTPTDFSAFFTRKPDVLRRAFSLAAEYLKTAEDAHAVNLMDYGLQLGRRFRALKFWFILRYFGRERIIEILRSHLGWAREFASWVEADPDFELMAPVPLALVCFRHRGSNELNQALMDRVNASGKAFLSHTVLKGRFTMRMAIGNVATTREDIAALWSLIRELSAGLA